METDANKIRNLYKKNSVARSLFDYFAKRAYDATETKVDRILAIMKNEGKELSRGQIIDVFKELEDLQCGKFVSGRRGWQSRFVWSVSLAALGKIAGGEIQELQMKSEDLPADEETETLTHSFHLRPDLLVKIELPGNLTANEASRLAEFIKALPFGEDEE